MALYHDASVSPTKAEMIERLLAAGPWAQVASGPIEVIGAFRFDDPEGRVGLETHLVRVGSTLVQVPLTYRPEPAADAEPALIGEMQHTALGARWVYDGLGDPTYVTMLAAVSLTGQGEALGMVSYDGVWHIAPTHVRIRGGGWTQERVPVDGFVATRDEGTTVEFSNERFTLAFHRLPKPAPQPALGLTATWNEQPDPVVLAEIAVR